MEWKDFNVERPIGMSRVLVCDTYFHEVRILVYNDFNECWDTEDGDDYYCDLGRIIYWLPLPDYVD
jgi:hypothetical protein